MLIKTLFPDAVEVVIATPEMWERPVKVAEEQSITSAVEKRKREYRAGRHSAAAVLSMLGIEDYSLLNDPQRAPIWPPGIIGSLTHCDNFCCAVAASQLNIASVGIDAEPLIPLPKESTPLICHEQELVSLQASGHTDNFWSKVIFSAKEAFYKAYFPLCRQYLDFLEAHVELHASQSKTKATRSGDFSIQLLTPPHYALYNQQSFSGRYLITATHIITAITLFKPS